MTANLPPQSVSTRVLTAPPKSFDREVAAHFARIDSAMFADKLLDGYGARNADRALALQINYQTQTRNVL